MINSPNKGYDVFRLVATDEDSRPNTYVARKHFVEKMDEVREWTAESPSRMAESLVNYHLRYLKNHPAIDENSETNHVSCFSVNINYHPPHHLRLDGPEVFKVKEFTSGEKEEFLQSLQSRLTEYWESDEDI